VPANRSLPSGVVVPSRDINAGARAEGPDEGAARAAFAEGRALAAEGDYERACRAFERSFAIVQGVGVMYNLADCYEKLGRAASAHALFTRAATLSAESGQRERAAAALERARGLERRRTRLLVDADARDESAVLRINEEIIESGKEVFLDPGTYRVTATAPGKKSWAREIIAPNGPALLSLSVPRLETLREPAPRPAPPPKKKRIARRSTPAGDAAPARITARPSEGPGALPWVLGASGVASLAAATYFGVRYKTKDDAARGVCPGAVNCSAGEIEQHAGLTEDARNARLFSFIGFGVGAAALGTATILFFSSGGEQRPRPRVSAGASLTPSGDWMAAVDGTF